MGVDTTLKYGQYNTYKMDANEKLYADPFDVSQYSVITMQLVTIRTAGATTCEVGARWIDANNRKMGSDVLLTVNVLNRFSDWHHTLEVPEGAMSLQWWIKAGSASFNWACGKISPGSMPTAFSVDLTERTSMMTADGLYTSTIKADQVVSGLLRALNGASWLNLNDGTFSFANGKLIFNANGDGRITSAGGSSYWDLDKPEFVQNAVIGGKNVKVTISPEKPVHVEVDGKDVMYISRHTGKLVTSPYDINEDGFVDARDIDLIADHIMRDTVYDSWIMDRLDVTGDGRIDSKDISCIIDNASFNYHDCYQRESEMTYKNANNLSFVVEGHGHYKMYTNNRVYPICITAPINAQIARSHLYVKPLNNDNYDEEILLYDPSGGFTSSSTAIVRYLYKQ